ncbi:MAG: hypothetical protein CALGDGBN_00125 [Pseudomonadales bacterium]|nr:hypothetical protein [Pseudomonadales bacterium]
MTTANEAAGAARVPLEGLPPCDQVGFVVRDLERSMAMYEPLFGPFHTMDGSVSQALFRGRLADVKLRIAFGHSGELQIELIEWGGGESPHGEFIQAGREGMHHIRFRVEDTDAWIERVRPYGYVPIWYKRWSDEIVFAYLEREGDPTLIEFLQMPEGHPG